MDQTLRQLYRRSDQPDAHPDPRPGGRLDRAALSELYAHPAPELGWVRTNFVSTLDGAAAGPDGLTGSINTAADRDVFALLRAHADVVFVGAGTARAEGYRAIESTSWQRELRAELGLSPSPTLAVLSHSLDLAPELTATADAGPVLVITDNHDADPEPLRSKDIEVIVLDGDHDQLAAAAIDVLVERGLRRILCEGGATVNRQLLAAGRVGDVCLTFAPTMIGGEIGRTVTGGLLGPVGSDDRPGVGCRLEHCLLGTDDTMITRWTLVPHQPGQARR